MHRDQKSPHAGAGRQPPDREVLRAAHRAAPEEAPQKVSWRVTPPPVAEYGTRVPSHLAGFFPASGWRVLQ